MAIEETTQMPTSAAREPRTATTMFVHDFAAVPGAVEEAVRKVSARTTSPKLEEIVRAAWNSHSQILGSIRSGPPASRPLVSVLNSIATDYAVTPASSTFAGAATAGYQVSTRISNLQHSGPTAPTYTFSAVTNSHHAQPCTAQKTTCASA